MKKLLFILLCLFGLQFSVWAQDQKKSSVKTASEDETYYFICECLIDNDGRVVSWVYFEPIPIKKSKSTNFAFDWFRRNNNYILPKKDENINGIADVFDKEYGFDKIALGKRVRDMKCDVFASLDRAKMFHRDQVSGPSYASYVNYTVAWQPPAKYTGIAPINTIPIIKPYAYSNGLYPIYSTYAETSNSKPTENIPNNIKPDKPKPTLPATSKPSQGYITVEKKDTKFEEAEAKK